MWCSIVWPQISVQEGASAISPSESNSKKSEGFGYFWIHENWDGRQLCETVKSWTSELNLKPGFAIFLLTWKWNNYLASDFKLDLEWFCETYLWSLCVPFSCRGDHSNLAKMFSLGKIFAKWFSSCLAIFEPTFNLRSGFLLFLQLEAERRVSDWFFWVTGVAPGPPIHLFSSRCQKIQI